MKIIIINGPNLNLLGKREPHIYGSLSFEDYFATLKEKYPHTDFVYLQSNKEGELVDFLQREGFSADGIVLNAASYTHTSIALRDAIAAISTPVIEVHISNVHSREEFRHHSYISATCKGTISGLGLKGYELAVQYFLNQ